MGKWSLWGPVGCIALHPQIILTVTAIYSFLFSFWSYYIYIYRSVTYQKSKVM